MITDLYGRVGISQEEIVDSLRKDSSLNYENVNLIDNKQYINSCAETFISMPKVNDWSKRNNDISVEEYHKQMQSNWLMPEEYKTLDIEQFLINKCKTIKEIERVNLELDLYKKFNLINLLRYLKYLRDTAKKNNIVWGVGRGSSCSSYCLFLLEIHKVDSLYYQLDINEFLRN